MRLKWCYFLRMSFHLIFEIFWLKMRKFLKLQKLETSKKASLPKWEGAKYAGGWRVSSFQVAQVYHDCIDDNESEVF